jgi:hypothetical protein
MATGVKTKKNRPLVLLVVLGWGLLMLLGWNSFVMPWSMINCVFNEDVVSDQPTQIHGEETMERKTLSPQQNGESSGRSSWLLWENSDHSHRDVVHAQDHDDDDCNLVMRRIRQLNDCSMSVECRNAHSYDQLPQPLLNTAFYAGQGLGRLIEHSVLTCLNAASVGRACLVDQTIRDSFYTFRSFVESTLDVDIDALALQYQKNHTYQPLLLSQATVEEAKRAISLLPMIELGHWTEADLQGANFHHVLPLGDENVTRDLVETIRRNPSKLVLSPNWGTSWFTERNVVWPSLMPMPSSTTNDAAVVVSDGSCHQISDVKLKSYMQNYMYRPTPLLHGLHKEYNKFVLGGRKKEVESYGAVHLRFYFLSHDFPKAEDDPVGSDRALRGLGANLHKCLRLMQEVDPTIQKWWLVSDDLAMGRNTTLFVNEEAARWEQQASNSTSSTPPPKLEVFMEDGWPEGVATTNRAQTVLQRILSRRHNGGLGHSVSDESTGPMGHEYLADSVIDWMVLHEAKISLMTQGAFGESGAQGNGKYYHPATREKERKSCLGLRTFRK